MKRKAIKFAFAVAKLAARGYALVPMHRSETGVCSCSKGANCKSPGKHPLTPNGVKNASSKMAAVNRWWRDTPKANIGIAVGASDLLVLDVDPRHGGDKNLAGLIETLGSLNAKVSADTGGGGQHYYFAAPKFAIKKDSGKILGDGLDILAGNSIAIAAPSVHASGKKYTWHDGKSLTTAVPGSLPKTWRDYIRAQQRMVKQKPAKAAAAEIKEGSRNCTLASIAGTLHTKLGKEAVLTALMEENKRRCVPPLDDDEVTAIVNSICAKPTSGKAITGDLAERVMKFVLDQSYSNGEHLLFGSDERFWHYGGTHWQVIQEAQLRGKILSTLPLIPDRGGTASSALIGQVVSLLKAHRAVGGDPLRFKAVPPSVINCRNGELWIGKEGKVELLPHSAKSYLTHCLSVEFDLKATCPRYDLAVKEIFESAMPSGKGMVRHWNEIVGYLIQPSRSIPSIVILRGSGGNGKTALMTTATKLLGDDAVSAQRIEALDKQFAMGGLLGKLALIDDDVKEGVRLSDGQLKKISEEKVVTGELKHGPTFNFVIRTLPFLLCNNVPSLADLSPGMRRRLMVIPFDRSFVGTKTPNPFENIWADEMPGVLNRAIEGLQRVIKRGVRFRAPEAIKQATDRWLVEANPLPAFVEECCSRDAKAICLLADFYSAFTEWSTQKGYTRIRQSGTLGRSIQHLGFAVRKRSRGQTIFGLKLK